MALGIFAVTSDQAPSPLDLFRICDVGFMGDAIFESVGQLLSGQPCLGSAPSH